jgi:hypothetical protein
MEPAWNLGSMLLELGIWGLYKDPAVRRFYINLGRHLLDRSFVLNSNNILIYWYSYASNELYFQV